MTTFVVIPARGGSKGIPKKNLVPLCGKPLIAWTIEQALAAETVDAVFVSTDCKEIAAVSREYGATVVERPVAIAMDTSSSELALLHFLHWSVVEPDLIVFLQCTSPIRQPYDIDTAVTMIQEANADSLLSVRQIEGFVHSTYHIPRKRPRRQDKTEWAVEENGSIYIVKPEVLIKSGSRAGYMSVYYAMHPLDSFQIDSVEDLEMIEALMPLRMGEHCT